MKIIVRLVIFIILLLGSIKFSLASGFHLSTIGSVDTGGRQISQWWYSGSNPVFHGEAVPGANITVDIDGVAGQFAADSSGNWDYQSPNGLVDGDHKIKFVSDGSEIDFTLTIGVANVNWDAVASGSAQTMPTVGTTWPTTIFILCGLVIMGMGGKMIVNVETK